MQPFQIQGCLLLAAGTPAEGGTQDEPGSAPASRGRASVGRQTHTPRGPFGLVPSPAPEQVGKGCSGLLPKH